MSREVGEWGKKSGDVMTSVASVMIVVLVTGVVPVD